MKKVNAILAAGAIALAGIGANQMAPQAPAPVQNVQQGQQDKQTAPLPVQQNQLIRETKTGGHVYVPKGWGIPPKIYGQQYVRRGTHKKTNKI